MSTEDRSNAVPCPFCEKPIDAFGDRGWRCPCCGLETDDWDPFRNCSRCRFSPHFTRCPSCTEEFEIHLLLMHETAPDGTPLKPDRRPDLPLEHSLKLSDLSLKVRFGSKDEPEAAPLLQAFVDHFESLSIGFPNRPSTLVFHTVQRHDEDLWLHGWLYMKAGTGDDPIVGQVSLHGEIDSERSAGKPLVLRHAEVAQVDVLPIVGRMIAQRTGSGEDRKTLIQLKTVEPFSASYIDVEKAGAIMRHFGRESFDFPSQPESLFIYEVRNRLPERSWAKGLLLDCSVDDVQTGAAGSNLPPHVVGRALLECGGDIQGTRLVAEACDPPSEAELEELMNHALRGERESGDDGRSAPPRTGSGGSGPQAKSGACPFVIATRGHDELLPGVEALRSFRDRHLGRSARGGLLLRLYERLAPAAAAMVGASELWAGVTRTLVLRPAKVRAARVGGAPRTR